MSNSWEGRKVGDLVNNKIANDIDYAGGDVERKTVHCPDEYYVYEIVKLPPEPPPTAEELLIDAESLLLEAIFSTDRSRDERDRLLCKIQLWKEAQDEKAD